MEAFDNAALFGADPDERIVAVEFVPPDVARVFRRDPPGGTVSEDVAFRPFLWSSDPDGGGEPLAGGLAFSRLREFETWDEFLAARDADKATVFAPGDPVAQFLMASGKTHFKGMEFGDLRRMQIDIETTCADGFEFSNAARDPLAGIAACDSSGWEDFIHIPPGDRAAEREAIERLGEWIAERDPDTVEGHNLFKFDLPYLAARAKVHKLALRWGRGGETATRRSSRLQIAEKQFQIQKFQIFGRHVIDTFLLAQFYDVGTRELQGFGLKEVARHFGVAEPGRIILGPDAIADAHATSPETLKTYALQDVRETRALSAVLSPSYFAQAKIFPFAYQDVILRGNATRIDALLLREYLRRRHSVPALPEPRAFEGGYTGVSVTGVIDNVWHCDVASLYPSVMLAFEIFPRNDALGLFRELLADLRKFRLEAKAAARAAADPSEALGLSALQNAFKILINSFYGYLGFAQGHFADFDAAAAVTAKGREILKAMVAQLEADGALVIEIDTDGIYFRPPEGATPDSLGSSLAAVLPDGIDVEFDRRYRAMFSYKAKNYALLDEDARLSLKGAALKSRGMEPYLREFLETMVRRLLERDADGAAALYAETLADLRARRVPVEKLAKTESLQDSPAAYQKKIASSARNRSAAFEVALASGRDYAAGDPVTYYISGARKKVVAFEAARPLSAWNPDAPDENVEYYAAKLEDLFARFSQFVSPPTAQGELF